MITTKAKVNWPNVCLLLMVICAMTAGAIYTSVAGMSWGLLAGTLVMIGFSLGVAMSIALDEASGGNF